MFRVLQRRLVLIVSWVAVFAAAAQARTLRVEQDGSGDFAVIQDALDQAAPGDTILVGPGRYLDSQWHLLPGASYETEVYAYVQIPSLTVIGAGAGETVIGPEEYESTTTFSPSGFAIGTSAGSFRLENVEVVNCYEGFVNRSGLRDIDIDQCRFFGNKYGVTTYGMEGIISNCVVEHDLDGRLGTGIIVHNGGVEIRDTVFMCSSGGVSVGPGGGGALIRGCTFTGGMGGINLWLVDGVEVRDCVFASMDNAAIIIAGVDHVIENNTIDAIQGVALTHGNSISQIRNNTLRSSDYSAVLISATPPWISEFHNNDILSSDGARLVHLRFYNTDPPAQIDMTDNYWGWTESDSISARIYDAWDDSTVGGYVIYEPFSTESVEAEQTSVGGLKRLFR